MSDSRRRGSAQTRNTKQRRVILEVLQDAPPHPTAAWIHREVKKKLPSVSLGTVYRNLNILTEQGRVQELACRGEFSLAVPEKSARYYVSCRLCGRVIETEMPVSTEVDREVAASTGFEIESHCMAFYGRCPDCLAGSSLRKGDARGDDS